MNSKTFGTYLMASTALAATGTLLVATPAAAQTAPAAPPPVVAPVAVPAAAEPIQAITVVGTQRLEADTVRSYIRLRVGQPWT